MVEKLEGADATTNENTEVEGGEPTTEQKLESLQAEFEAEKEAREKAEKRTQGLEGSLKQKDIQIKGQATKTDIDAINRQMELLATAVVMGKNPDNMDGVTEDTQKAVIKQIQEARKESEEAQRQVSIETSNQKYAEEALEIWTETKGIIPETDRDAVEIYRLLKNGDKDTAEKMLNSIKANKKDSKGTETEEEIEERLTKKILQERGLNKGTGAISPSGGIRSFTRQQIAEMSPKEYAEKRPEIEAAMVAEKIK